MHNTFFELMIVFKIQCECTSVTCTTKLELLLAGVGRLSESNHRLRTSRVAVSFEGPSPRGRHTTVAVGTLLFIFGGGAMGSVYDDLWALDTDGEGLLALEHDVAMRAGEGQGVGLDASGISLSFLVPQQIAAEKPKEEFPPELEYEDGALHYRYIAVTLPLRCR